MQLNCDLGEGFGAWNMGQDEAVMPLIDMANIACGVHAGDADVMAKTIALAKKHDVIMGAHPSYPDRAGFGRRSMQIQQPSLVNLIQYQIATLQGMAAVQGAHISYVKPHGALYNDMKLDSPVTRAVLEAISSYPLDLPLVVLANRDWQKWLELAADKGLTLQFEVFADRCYLPDGRLMPRAEAGAVLNHQQALDQVQRLFDDNCIKTSDGSLLSMKADTLCVHGDTPAALEMLTEIRELLSA